MLYFFCAGLVGRQNIWVNDRPTSMFLWDGISSLKSQMPLKANARCLGYCYYPPTGKSYAASNCIPIQQTWVRFERKVWEPDLMAFLDWTQVPSMNFTYIANTMQLIKPRQISGEIMTLIEEADHKVILVTPYFKVRNWYKLLNTLNYIRSKSIDIEIFIRDGEMESIREVRELGFEPISIPNLHTKLYLNEKVGIVSSMNLLHSSDTNSLDIALKTETEKEYNELWDYYLRYIKRSSADTQVKPNARIYDWRSDLEKRLRQSFGYILHIKEQPNRLTINANNRYEVSISSENKTLRLSGILSQKEYEYAIKAPGSIRNSKLRIEYLEGGEGQYNTVWGISSNIKSPSISETIVDEAMFIVDLIVEFIEAVEQLKNASRQIN